MTALLLGPVSKSKFGQNERSTFAFLMSHEPYGFSYFLENRKENYSYTLDILWDYLKHNLEPSILSSPLGHKWSEASISIKRIEDKNEDDHVKVLKAIAIINLFGKPYNLIASDVILKLIYKGLTVKKIDKILQDLKNWSVTVYKKYLKSYAIFAGSDIDLDDEIKKLGVSSSIDIESYYSKFEIDEYVIAKRHYHEKGTLRWLDKRICLSSDLLETLDSWESLKGEFASFILTGKKIDNPELYKDYKNVIGYTKNFEDLKILMKELVILEHAEKNISELAGDDVARKELYSRLDDVYSNLNSCLDDCFHDACWFFKESN